MKQAITTGHYFGGCPECGKVDGMANVYKTHWFFCKDHKTMWSPGSNLFSSARMETEEFQRNRWNEIGLEEFTIVNPIMPEEFLDKEVKDTKLDEIDLNDAALKAIHNYLFGDDEVCA